MRRQQTKQCAAWQSRREQYLRESGRHVDLIREGYASEDDATNWTAVAGGRARGPLKPRCVNICGRDMAVAGGLCASAATN